MKFIKMDILTELIIKPIVLLMNGVVSLKLFENISVVHTTVFCPWVCSPFMEAIVSYKDDGYNNVKKTNKVK